MQKGTELQKRKMKKSFGQKDVIQIIKINGNLNNLKPNSAKYQCKRLTLELCQGNLSLRKRS